MSTTDERSARAEPATARKKKVTTYHEIAPGWRLSADADQWTLERQRETEKAGWGLVGYYPLLSQALGSFASARVRTLAGDGSGILESVQQAANELADLIARIKDATLVLEQPRGVVR